MSAVVTPSIDEDIEDLWQTLTEEERSWVAPEPLALVIFGATGDLTHRKLIPALYNLAANSILPEKLAIVGFGRSERDPKEFSRGLRTAVEDSGVQVRDDVWESFAGRIRYMQGGYDDVDSYKRLAKTLTQIDKDVGTENHRLFYLSTPPTTYMDVVRNLGAAGLNKPSKEKGWSRLIIEKPFGRDLESARQLNRCIHEVFDESQVYRIDHYLGKETVQNIFVLRFINGIFEPLWNRNYIDNVQITVAESVGVEGRGGYYDEAGAVRDMLQSHILQLLTLIAMEPPSAFTPDRVRDEKVKVFDSLQFGTDGDWGENLVRGQYSRGTLDGEELPGYRDEEGVGKHSTTETFVAAKLTVDNWRWAGVPFYLRTGKRMPRRVSEVAIQFRRAPHLFLPGTGRKAGNDVLVLRIQPDDGLALRFNVKVPGPSVNVQPVDMSFLYKDFFAGTSPDAYQRLLLDAMRGDSTLFARTDEVEAAWTLVTPLLDEWNNEGIDVRFYPSGSWGPTKADELLAQDGFSWRKP